MIKGAVMSKSLYIISIWIVKLATVLSLFMSFLRPHSAPWQRLGQLGTIFVGSLLVTLVILLIFGKLLWKSLSKKGFRILLLSLIGADIVLLTMYLIGIAN